MGDLEKMIDKYPKYIRIIVELFLAFLLLAIPTVIVGLVTDYTIMGIANTVMIVYLFLVVYQIGKALVIYILKMLY